jgi:hypothetical protein
MGFQVVLGYGLHCQKPIFPIKTTTAGEKNEIQFSK